MNEIRCDSCDCWEKRDTPEGDRLNIGKCKRFPPNIIDPECHFLPAHSPTTQGYDYCGEWIHSENEE